MKNNYVHGVKSLLPPGSLCGWWSLHSVHSALLTVVFHLSRSSTIDRQTFSPWLNFCNVFPIGCPPLPFKHYKWHRLSILISLFLFCFLCCLCYTEHAQFRISFMNPIYQWHKCGEKTCKCAHLLSRFRYTMCTQTCPLTRIRLFKFCFQTIHLEWPWRLWNPFHSNDLQRWCGRL